jgi:hypothetical protein
MRVKDSSCSGGNTRSSSPPPQAESDPTSTKHPITFTNNRFNLNSPDTGDISFRAMAEPPWPLNLSFLPRPVRRVFDSACQRKEQL